MNKLFRDIIYKNSFTDIFKFFKFLLILYVSQDHSLLILFFSMNLL